MKQLVKVAITQGDHNGIGLEATLKSLADEEITTIFTPILFADRRLVEAAQKAFGLQLPHLKYIESPEDAVEGRLNVVDIRLNDATIEAGHPTPASGIGSVISLKAALAAVKDGSADVIVTAPISKEAAHSDSFNFTGHTEFLSAEAGADAKELMILFDDRLRVALVTTHLPIAEVAKSITQERVEDYITRLNEAIRTNFGILRPKIAVLSLNPHSGDGGLLGEQEQTAIIPAIENASSRHILAFGPYAADGFFGSEAYRNFDAVLAMYHDQGLAPFKTISRSAGVNFTAGLPWVRTSPDHGTAYDIAWKGEADETSMREAIYSAIEIYRSRKAYLEASANPLRFKPEKSDRGEKMGNAEKNRRPDKNNTRMDQSRQAEEASAPANLEDSEN